MICKYCRTDCAKAPLLFPEMPLTQRLFLFDVWLPELPEDELRRLVNNPAELGFRAEAILAEAVDLEELRTELSQCDFLALAEAASDTLRHRLRVAA